jgi:hypothetical protein
MSSKGRNGASRWRSGKKKSSKTDRGRVPMRFRAVWRLEATLLRLARNVWAFPATLLGLGFVPLAWLSGGIVRTVLVVLEIHGGWPVGLLRKSLPHVGGAAAMTPWQVIVARDQRFPDRGRQHKHVHVRQYERWGSLLLPYTWRPAACCIFGAGNPTSTTRSSGRRWVGWINYEISAERGAHGSTAP